ncbi:Glycosyltransferase, catalytic subunit of cellulose synthase and poly-beta-1,6-N-acetylglucosamine synthase [Halogranum rubrum]|uniref:Glycosyltransferase, catalytic subunit of cellulose synthase and poly-beta-1,6-N-acetylglucosamine synthase n=1 Tax=Halogranum rubrum TaxID=553466 RepID=A0A1I4I5D5_9EURY|nr:glycosyltransferase [Halogranum rubrum]SFL49678.1 Glycosyltransferase, catalytic subunit of cellulose synthase and poly-beta-1,6-N-acetylglucosamine synthase [Halogranum rubrum]
MASKLSDAISALICLVALIPYGLLLGTLPQRTFFAIATFTVVLAGYLLWSYYVVEWRPEYESVFSVRGLAVVLVLTAVGVVLLKWVPPSPVAFVHLGALVLFFSYWLVMVIALYHELRAKDEFVPLSSPEPISVLVPAYNEEGYIGGTIEALLATEFPRDKLSIVVVDDGSTDETYEEAAAYESDIVSVVRKENGGKYSALNYGLLFTDDEFIVTVDADSVVHPTALTEIVTPLQTDSTVGAVAGNVKVSNRDSLVTKCQSLEYIFGINIYRRVFDHFGVVPIVPGCLGAYRRDALEAVCAYDPQTLTEDFDTTVKVLKAGYDVRVSKAQVFTEAPDTWKDLYKQRLRWYRGNFMTFLKHFDDLMDTRHRMVHRLWLPLSIVEMFFLPFASWVILGVIVYLLVSGLVAQTIALFAFFTSIVILINVLALKIEGEEFEHILYAPLFVIGYKHFHDAIMVKSLIDVVRDTDMQWTSASRIKQRDQSKPATHTQPETRSD